MSSIHNIPEPTTGYRPVVDESAPAPTGVPGADPLVRRPDCAGQEDTSRPATEVDEELGSKTWVVMLTLSGLLLRGLLLYFGLLGIDSDAAAAWATQGSELTQHGPAALDGQLPIYPLVMAGLSAVGIPLGVMSIVQALLGVLAIPAAYAVAKKLTGRDLAGVGAAALMALHPGVLAWTTAAAPGGLGCALVVIGLYLLLKTEKNGETNAWPAGVLFAIAALTAPAAWLIGLGAACGCVAQGDAKKRIISAAIVLTLSVGPIAAWSALYGQGLTQPLATAQTSTALPHLAALTDQSLNELGNQLRFEMQPNGILTRIAEGRTTVPIERDPVADAIGDGWVALNAAILVAAAVSLALLLVRRRFAAAAMLSIPLLVLLATGLPLGEPHRMALFGPLAILAFGGLCTHAAAHLTAEEREALLQEKELNRQQKLEAKQQHREKKYGLYAFDKPKKRKAAKKLKTKPGADAELSPDASHALAGTADTEPAMSRPI
ncbi:glycosyltransferase family 39 protein [Phycisphaeraceae bacterium D3-23]